MESWLTSGDGGFGKDGVLGTTSPLTGDGGFDKGGVWGTTSPQLITWVGGLDWRATSPQLTKRYGGGGGNMWWSVRSSRDKGVDGMFLPATTKKKPNANRQIMVSTFISAIIIFYNKKWEISIKSKESY